MKWINRLYILFLGIVLSITTGFGIAAFYPQPTSPYTNYYQNTPKYCYETPESQASAECKKIFEKERADLQKNEQAQREFMNKNAGYTRTAIFLGIVIGATFAILGIALLNVSKLIVNGLLLAAVLTAVLTRFLISLASLGSSVSGTNGPDQAAFIEFFVLLLLSVAIVLLGLFRLKETS